MQQTMRQQTYSPPQSKLADTERTVNMDDKAIEVMQGAVRINTYLGIPLVIAFYGSETIALGALFIAFMVPFINVLSVWVLAV